MHPSSADVQEDDEENSVVGEAIEEAPSSKDCEILPAIEDDSPRNSDGGNNANDSDGSQDHADVARVKDEEQGGSNLSKGS